MTCLRLDVPIYYFRIQQREKQRGTIEQEIKKRASGKNNIKRGTETIITRRLFLSRSCTHSRITRRYD